MKKNKANAYKMPYAKKIKIKFFMISFNTPLKRTD